MNNAGFFGLLVLLVAVQIILFTSASSNENTAKHLHVQNRIIEIQKSNLQRTELEINADKIIEEELHQSFELGFEPEIVKNKISARILELLAGHESGLCIDSLLGEKKIGGLTLESLGSITKTGFTKAGSIVLAQYSVTGKERGLFPCARINSGKHAAYFRIPLGYTMTKVVPLP